MNPDAKDFAERAKSEDIQINLKEYEKASHIWILKGKDDLANKAFIDLVAEIKNWYYIKKGNVKKQKKIYQKL